MSWLGLVLGGVLFAAAIFYLVVGFFPETSTSQKMRGRLELAADVGRARGYRINSAGLYAWLFRTKPRAALVVLFLLFWAIWFLAAALRA